MYDIILFLFILLPAKTLCGWVVAAFLILSSLGTNFARADFSNVVTKSLGQNGYYKFPDGFMLQYGYVSASNGSKTVYLPTTFLNTNYSINLTIKCYASTAAVISPMLTGLYTSYFTMKSRFVGTDAILGDGGEPFFWIAIGRWK